MSACLNSLLFYCCVADGRCSRAPLLVMRALSIPFTLDVMTWSSSRCLERVILDTSQPPPALDLAVCSLVCDLMASNKRGIVRCGHGVLHCDSLHKEGNCSLWTWSITLWLTAQRGELFVVDMEYYTVTHCTKRGIVRCGHGVLHCDSLHKEGNCSLWTWNYTVSLVVDMEYYTVTHCRKRGIVRCGHGVLHCDSLQKEGNCSLWTWSITLWLTAERGELFVVDMEYYTVTHCRKRGIVRCGHGVLHCDSLQKEGNCSLWTWSIILWLTAQRGSSKRNFVLQFYENQMSVFATIYALIYSGRGSRRFPSWCTDSKLKMCGDRFLYLNLENMACFYTFQARNNQGICCCCWLCDWKRCRENFFFLMV